MMVSFDQSLLGEGESRISFLPEKSENGCLVSLSQRRTFEPTGGEGDAETDVFVPILHCQPAGVERERHQAFLDPLGQAPAALQLPVTLLPGVPLLLAHAGDDRRGGGHQAVSLRLRQLSEV